MFSKIGWLLAVLFASRLAADTILDRIRAEWRAHEYPETYEATEQYRKTPYGKRLEVYYMGGTSLCRIAGRADRGAIYIQWIIDNFALDSQDRATVNAELHACQTAANATAPVAITVNAMLASATSSGHTKMFYYEGGNNAMRSVPVKVVRQLREEELLRRLFSSADVERAKASVKQLAGSGANVDASAHFVLAGSHQTPTQLRAVGQQLDKVYNFFLTEYAMPAPESLITVYLEPDAAALRARALALHGIEVSPQSIGYSYQADMSMVGIIGATSAPVPPVGTLQHELFHLMVRNNFGDIPPWLDEGMAGLYEVTKTEDGRVVGMPNWRGPVLQQLRPLQPSVKDLVKMNWLQFSGGENEYDTARQAAIHAKARYLMLYLQNKQKLRDVYRAFQSREIGSDPAALLSATLQTDLSALEHDFQDWFATVNR